jgi:hypothetical protein
MSAQLQLRQPLLPCSTDPHIQQQRHSPALLQSVICRPPPMGHRPSSGVTTARPAGNLALMTVRVPARPQGVAQRVNPPARAWPQQCCHTVDRPVMLLLQHAAANLPIAAGCCCKSRRRTCTKRTGECCLHCSVKTDVALSRSSRGDSPGVRSSSQPRGTQAMNFRRVSPETTVPAPLRQNIDLILHLNTPQLPVHAALRCVLRTVARRCRDTGRPGWLGTEALHP